MSKMKLFSVLLVGLFTLLGASVAAQEDVTLRFTLWIPPDAPQMEAFNTIAANYEADNTNVTIEYDFIPFNDYESVLTLQLSGTNPPDAGWLVERSAPTFTQAGVLKDIGEDVRGNAEYNFDDFSEPAMGLWIEGDSVYGIPFSTSPFVFIYNRSLFEEAGVPLPDELIEQGDWTWARVAEIADTITEETGSFGFQSNDAALYTGNFWITLVPIMRAFGGDAWNEQNECLFNSEGSVEALSLLHSMIFEEESAVPPGTEVNFYAGSAGATIGQLSRLGQLTEADFEWDIAPLPAGSAGTPYVIGQAAISVFNNSENPDIATDFVMFMTNEENVSRLAAFFPPARSSVLESQAFLDANPLLDAETIENVVAEAIQNGQVLPSHPNFPVIELTVRPLLDTLWVSGADVEAVAGTICQSIEPLLSQ